MAMAILICTVTRPVQSLPKGQTQRTTTSSTKIGSRQAIAEPEYRPATTQPFASTSRPEASHSTCRASSSGIPSTRPVTGKSIRSPPGSLTEVLLPSPSHSPPASCILPRTRHLGHKSPSMQQQAEEFPPTVTLGISAMAPQAQVAHPHTATRLREPIQSD